MTAIRFSALTTALIGFCTFAMPAAAQNHDAQHQVRVGAFGQFGRIGGALDVATPGTSLGNGGYGYGTAGVGVSAGLEWVNKNRISWGVEIDGVTVSGDGSQFGTELGANYLATARLRAGYHMRPDIFWYVTGGYAMLGSEIKRGTSKVSNTNTGYALGTGLEWDFGAGLLFGEYLYAGLGNVTAVTGAATHIYDADQHAFRFGVKFKVGHDHYHDDVAHRIGRTP